MGCSSGSKLASGMFPRPMGHWTLMSSTNLKPDFCSWRLRPTVYTDPVGSGTKEGLELLVSGHERVAPEDSDCYHLSSFSFLGILTRLDFSELGLGMELRGRKSKT